MRTAFSDIARKALALLILLVAAWFLFHLVIGVVAAVAWIVVAAIAVAAIIWAIRAL